MTKGILLTLLALMLAAGARAAEVDADCSMCHGEAPVPDGHPPVQSVSAESCGMCHAPGGDDGYFQRLHNNHLDAGLDCSACHGATADAELQAKLDDMLGR